MNDANDAALLQADIAYDLYAADPWEPPAEIDATFPGDEMLAAAYGPVTIPELGDPEGAYARDPGE